MQISAVKMSPIILIIRRPMIACSLSSQLVKCTLSKAP